MTKLPLKSLFFILLLFLSAACLKTETGAREVFSRSYSCPVDRITITPTKLQHPNTDSAKEAPPSDVASDPDRLSVWKANRDRERKENEERQERMDSAEDRYTVKGCDREELLSCWHPTASNSNGTGGSVKSSLVSCRVEGRIETAELGFGGILLQILYGALAVTLVVALLYLGPLLRHRK